MFHVLGAVHEARTSGGGAIIVAHNHPSGDTVPSDADVLLTLQLRDAAKLLRLRLLDSVVMTANSYASLAELRRL